MQDQNEFHMIGTEEMFAKPYTVVRKVKPRKAALEA